MSNIGALVAGEQPNNGRKAREFAGFKNRLRFSSANGLHVECEVRYSKADVDTIFEVPNVKKIGPHGGFIRWGKGEWKCYEADVPVWILMSPDGKVVAQTPDPDVPIRAWSHVEAYKIGQPGGHTVVEGLKEIEISPDTIKYQQDVDGVTQEVDPFEATKVWDIKEDRPLDQCTLDGPIALGSVIPREKMDEFGPDKDSGSSLYKVWGDDQALVALAEHLEKERIALYYPHVFRKGLTIHLACATIVRFNNTIYMIMKTFGGPVKLDRPLRGIAVAVPVSKPVLVKPIIRSKKPTGVQ